MVKEAKNAKYPHNFVIDTFEKDSANISPVIMDKLEELLRNRYADGALKYMAVLQYYYRDGLTMEQTANTMSLSRERIRQMIANLKRTMRIFGDILFPIDPDEYASELKSFTQLRARTSNALHRYGVSTIDEIVDIPPDILIDVRSVGPNGLKDIMESCIGKDYLAKYWPDMVGIDIKRMSSTDIYSLFKNYRRNE